jgi:hypothetical protein
MCKLHYVLLDDVPNCVKCFGKVECWSPLVAIDGTKKHVVNNMDKILEEAGLSSLLQRFKDERIESEFIVAMTDEELTRLGVTMIGDRVRLCAVCRKKKDLTETESTSSTNVVQPSNSYPVASSSAPHASSSSVSSAASIALERARLFNPRHNSRNSSRKRKASGGANRTWTAQFFCLADRNQSKVPNASTNRYFIMLA